MGHIRCSTLTVCMTRSKWRALIEGGKGTTEKESLLAARVSKGIEKPLGNSAATSVPPSTCGSSALTKSSVKRLNCAKVSVVSSNVMHGRLANLRTLDSNRL